MTEAERPPGLIPDRLLNRIREENCLLFLGADLPLGYPGAPLSRPELAAALAQEYDLPPGRSWPETAQAYLGRFLNDRNGLMRFVMKHTGKSAGPFHQAVARAGFHAIVTSWYDEWLDQALRQAGYRVHRVVHDRQLPYSQEGEQEVILVKLFGCTSDPASLVLGERERARMLTHLNRKLEAVISFAQLRPLLFVGHDLADPTLIQLYERACENVVEDMHRSYAIWPQPGEAMRAAWSGINLEWLDFSPTPFFESLAAQIPAAAPVIAKQLAVRRPPYKFLDYYVPADADIFCGRDTESQIVTRLALSHRLLALFGPSGAGKTSLLLAGVGPRLAGENYQHVYVRALDNPLPAVRKAVAARAGREAWTTGPDLRAFLSLALSEGDRLVVILDQFEELFLRVGSTLRGEFFQQLAEALAQPERDVRFIFSLREDYLPYLDEARASLPDIFTHSFRLSALDRGHARVAITEPAARAGVEIEPALVDALVGSEGRGVGSSGGDLVEADGTVPPPALQIVLDKLYRTALPANHDAAGPPPPGMKLTLQAYHGFSCCLGQGPEAEQLHGAQAILASYLDEGLAKLAGLEDEAGRPLGADPQLGWEMLKALVTSQHTKSAVSQAEIADLLDEAGVIGMEDEAGRKTCEATRLGLERVRLLRSFERDGRAYYELAHDHLAAAVAARLSQEEVGVKVARELLRPALDNWRTAKLLIPPEAFKLINARREDLRRLKADELELLLRSAIPAGLEGQYWAEQAQARGVNITAILQEELASPDFHRRAGAVRLLGSLGEPLMEPAIAALSDPYPQVRMAAIAALEAWQPTGEWRKHLKFERYIPAGSFVMGNDKGANDEQPAHPVFLEAFYIARYPVTNAEFRRYCETVGRPFQIPAGRDDHPAVAINWYDARNYAAWAGTRLLSEAEWEKAASWEEDAGDAGAGIISHLRDRLAGKALHGKKRRYPWGDDFDQRKCNTSESKHDGTTPVGQYSPDGDSPYGCADMAGNVWEWTSSLKKPYPYQASDEREDAEAPGVRVLRGGSWVYNGDDARCAFRDYSYPNGANDASGFRVGVSSRK